MSAQQFPYTAYVTESQAYLRSGPGQRYYPTGQVPQGYAVEVYRHDADGWCAIRPPEGSFSWVPTHQVRPVEPQVVEIAEDNVVTRVGSTMSPNRSAVQVLLPRGERLNLLPAGDNDDPRWVRIAAPAGEFRWVAASMLSRQPPLEVAPVQHVESSGWSRQSPQHATAVATKPNAFDHLNQSQDFAGSGANFDPPSSTPSAPSIREPAPLIPSDSNKMDVVAGSPAEQQLTQRHSQSLLSTQPNVTAAVEPVAESGQPRVRFHGLSSVLPTTAGSVEELELRLSQAVVYPPQQWQLDPLEAAANSLLAQTKAPPVRAQLREVLERITRFQEVQERYNNPSPTIVAQLDPFESNADEPLPPTQDSSGLTGLSSSVRERVRQDFSGESTATSARPTMAANKPLYDATGLLKPVVSKRAKAPQYALVDERGKVVSFVTPTPDLNLKPYVGRRIGVHGTRGFMPEYRRAHVTAGRVTPIEGTIRR